MTIYGVGYRKLEYMPEPVWRRLQALAAIEFRSLFRSRWGGLLFILCLVPSIFSMFVMLGYMGVLQFGDQTHVGRLRDHLSHQLPTDPELLRMLPDHLHFYLIPIIRHSIAPFLIITALVSSRSIAKDRAANAMELIWTRGISPRGYLLAKWLGSASLLFEMGVGLSLLLWLTGVFLAPDWDFLHQTWTFMPATLLALFVFTVVLSYWPVALSALANTANMGSILWVMLLMGSMAAGHVLAEGMRDPSWLPLISVWDAAGTVAGAIAGMRERSDAVTNGVINLAVVTVVLTVLMLRRMRLREAVG